MTNHTPEPWATEERGIIYSLHPDWRGPWAISLGDRGRNFTRELDEANARRVVACINAGIGIPTEKLEKYWPNGGLLTCVEIHEAVEKAKQYKKQNVELLQTAKALLAYAQDITDEGPQNEGWKSEKLTACLIGAKNLIAECEDK